MSYIELNRSGGYMMITASVPCCVYPGQYILQYLLIYNNAQAFAYQQNIVFY